MWAAIILMIFRQLAPDIKRGAQTDRLCGVVAIVSGDRSEIPGSITAATTFSEK
jgi:hypothetical protein